MSLKVHGETCKYTLKSCLTRLSSFLKSFANLKKVLISNEDNKIDFLNDTVDSDQKELDIEVIPEDLSLVFKFD